MPTIKDLDREFHEGIDEVIEGLVDPPSGKKFSIETLEDANFIAGLIRAKADRIKESQKVFNDKCADIDKFANRKKGELHDQHMLEIRPYQQDIKGLLFCYKEQLLDFIKKEHKKKKSVTIAGLKFGTKKTPDKLVIEDQNQLDTWARKHDFGAFTIKIKASDLADSEEDLTNILEDSPVEYNKYGVTKLKEYMSNHEGSKYPEGVKEVQGQDVEFFHVDSSDLSQLIELEVTDE